jgi:hypothetical protein
MGHVTRMDRHKDPGAASPRGMEALKALAAADTVTDGKNKLERLKAIIASLKLSMSAGVGRLSFDQEEIALLLDICNAERSRLLGLDKK